MGEGEFLNSQNMMNYSADLIQSMAYDMAIAFLISVFFAGIIIPQILLIAFRKNLFDVPDERKIHTSAVPRLGGIAFKLVTLFSVFFVLGINHLSNNHIFTEQISADALQFCFGFCALMLIYIVGIADDLIGVRYKAKFVVQALSALLIVASGLYINNFHGLFGLYEVNPYFGGFVTVVAIVFITNAINLIDGVDGLASGLCIVAFAYYGVIFFCLGLFIYALIAFSVLGTVIQFYYYNVFGKAEKQKKIFMGDTGSLTLGIFLCFLSLKLNQVPDTNTFVPNAFVMAFAPLIVPCFDVIRVYIHRLRKHRSPFLPDKNHIHHKIMRCGISQRTTMVSIILFAIFIALANFELANVLNINVLVIGDLVFYYIGHGILNKILAKKENWEKK